MTKYSSPQLYGLEIGRGLWHVSLHAWLTPLQRLQHPAEPFLKACDYTDDDIDRTEIRDDPPDQSAMCLQCLRWMYVNEIGFDYDDIPRHRYLVNCTLSVEAVDAEDAVDKVRDSALELLRNAGAYIQLNVRESGEES